MVKTIFILSAPKNFLGDPVLDKKRRRVKFEKDRIIFAKLMNREKRFRKSGNMENIR